MRIFSVFGQIERVAARIMIDAGEATEIEFEQIPPSVQYNDANVKASFAVMFSGTSRRVRELSRKFDALIVELRQ